MKTTLLLSKAKSIFTALMPACRSRAPLTDTAAQERPQPLDDHLAAHLSAYSDLQTLLQLGMKFEKLRESRDLKHDAGQLAQRIASIPYYLQIEPLHEARTVLVRHWRTSWTNGCISATAYRTRLMGALVFIRSQKSSPFRANPI